MGNCHYCMNCGRCRGEAPKPFLMPRCLQCGHENPRGQEQCERCGASLYLIPGITNTVAGDDENGD